MWLLLSVCAQGGCTVQPDPDAGFVKGVSEGSDTPCESQPRPLGWEQVSPLGFAPSSLRPLLEGLRMETVQWANGKRTELVLELTDLRVSYVDQRAAAGHTAASYGDSCSDYVRIEATLYIDTGDGELSNVERPITLRATSSEEAFGSVLLEPGSFEGSFAPLPLSATCLRSLRLKLLMSESGPAGSLTQEHSAGRCEDANLTIRKQLLVGHWGIRWQSY